MIIELPKKFNYESKAKMEDGVLKILPGAYSHSFMNELTIAIKGKTCWYCGRKLSNSDITIDHLYPQDLGGPYITNNLAPTCSECNGHKGNLTERQYRNWLAAPSKQKSEIKKRFLASNMRQKRKKGYYLPREWITTRKIDNILVNFIMSESYLGKRYKKTKSFYQEFGHLPHPIIVDRNNYLLDGFIQLMFAKNNGITRIPTIVLDNVEVILNR